LISSVELPDERRRYYFKYNVYGELARVELPTGAAIEYDWVGAYASGYNILRWVSKRRVFPEGGTGSTYASQTTYTFQSGVVPNTLMKVETRDADGVLLEQSHHHFTGYAASSFLVNPYQYPPWTDGREVLTKSFEADGSSLLRQVENIWE